MPSPRNDATKGEDGEVLLQCRRFRVVRRAQTLSDGRRHEREIVEHPGAVVILPLLDADRVCLIRNQRISVARTLMELPAGTLEPGENPQHAAERELTEETGYHASRVERMPCEFYTSPGICNERMYFFVATGLTAGHQELDAGEEIVNEIVTWEEALRMAGDGRIEDGKTLAALLWYDRFRRSRMRE